jgi:glyoxylate utilization-related uncharacterized protein
MSSVRLLIPLLPIYGYGQQYFSYIVDVSFIGGGNQSTQRSLARFGLVKWLLRRRFSNEFWSN